MCIPEVRGGSKQLLRETRSPLPAKPGVPAKQDYEYERAGTCNIFLAVEPRGQRRTTQVTARRTKIGFVCRMLRTHPVIATVSSNDS